MYQWIKALLLALSLTTGCATNPVTGKNELALVSQGEEISIGHQQYTPAQQSQGGQYVVDPALTRYVQTVGDRLAAVSDSDLPYEFVVLNDSTPNAWALPGGKIAINRGLLTALNNEAELAAVLGHEIVHAAARHGAKSMERSMLLQGAILITAISASDSDYANYIMGGATLGAQLISQQYGRGAELESDYYGMQYMVRAGYDPRAAITLQEKFVALSQGRSASWIQGLFASHPPSEQRVLKNKETSKTLMAETDGDWILGEQSYQQALAYLRSKEDAYVAFDQAMSLAAKKEYSAATNRVNRAIELEPKEPRFYGLKGNLYYQQEQFDQAVTQFNEAVARDDNYYEYYLGRGFSHVRLGNKAQAQMDLERSNQLLPTAMATNALGNLSLASGNLQAAKQYFGEVANTGGSLSKQAAARFVELDIQDNPARYFQVSNLLRDGYLYSIITNQSHLTITSGVVGFSAVINGRPLRGQATVTSLGPGGTASVTPGWRISETDQVEQLRVQMIQARL